MKKPPAHEVLVDHIRLVHDYLDDLDSGGAHYDTGLNIVSETACCCLARMNIPAEARTEVLNSISRCLVFRNKDMDDLRILGFRGMLSDTMHAIKNNDPYGCDH